MDFNKLLIIPLAFILAVAVIGGNGDDDSSDNAYAMTSNYDDNAIVEMLKKEIEWYNTTGVKEGSDGVYYCKWGNKAFGSSLGNKYSWCATFVSYMLIEKFHVFSDVKSSNLLSRSVSGLMAAGKKQGIYHDKNSYTPQIGDIVIQKTGKSHTGIYIGDGKMIAGNTSNAVKEQKVASGLTGYIHITYSSSYSTKSTSSNAKVSGNSNAEKVWNYMRSAGMTREATAGVMGNVAGESSFNPSFDTYKGKKSTNDKGGYGVFSETGNRANSMREYCKKKYNDQYSLQGQLEYFIQIECAEQFKVYTGKGYPKKYKYIDPETKTYTTYGWGTKMTFNDYMKLNDISKATEIFMRVTLRPGKPWLKKNRIPAAKKYYNNKSYK